MSPADVLTVLEAADELGLDPAEVYDLVFSRKLGFSQTETGRIQVPRAALETYRQREPENRRTSA